MNDKELYDVLDFLRVRQEKLIDWMMAFLKNYSDNMQFIMETALMANINPELKKRVYLNKRMDEMEEMFKNFLAYYNQTPHYPTLKELSKSDRRRKSKEYKFNNISLGEGWGGEVGLERNNLASNPATSPQHSATSQQDNLENNRNINNKDNNE